MAIRPEEDAMSTDAGDVTGTADKGYNIIWFTEACLSSARTARPRRPPVRARPELARCREDQR